MILKVMIWMSDSCDTCEYECFDLTEDPCDTCVLGGGHDMNYVEREDWWFRMQTCILIDEDGYATIYSLQNIDEIDAVIKILDECLDELNPWWLNGCRNGTNTNRIW